MSSVAAWPCSAAQRSGVPKIDSGPALVHTNTAYHYSPFQWTGSPRVNTVFEPTERRLQ